MRMTLAHFALSLLLAGCGAIYHGTKVREGVSDGADIRVIAVTPETLLAANRAPYNPRSLPAAFRTSAGSARAPSGREGLPAPIHTAETRPSALPRTDAPPPPSDTTYRIGVGDVVLLATRNSGTATAAPAGLAALESRRQGYTVQDDGAVAIPDIGRIRIADMTVDEAEAVVFQRLVERNIDPSFSLELAQFNARQVQIGGAVAEPGVVPVTLTPLTLDAALARVGGVLPADRDSAVIRIWRDGKLYQIPVQAFLSSAALQKTRLADGDSIFVDAQFDLAQAEAWFTQQIRLSEVTQANRAAAMTVLNSEIGLRRQELSEQRENFTSRIELGAEKRDYVFLTGEVRLPGRMPLPWEQQLSLADALFEKGGVQPKTGDPRQIYVLRGSSDPREFGAITAWHVDAGTATGWVLATRLELRPDDVILVAEQPVTRWSRVIDQISPNLITVPVNAALNE